MLFHETKLPGAYIIELEKRGDDRGFFARLFCLREFSQNRLVTDFVQVNTSMSVDKGTLRGLHYQLPPHAETKLVRCTRGAIWDCILDLRPDSPTFGQWYADELSDENRRMMYVPKGFAHGFVTLTGAAEAIYLVDEFYSPEAERTVRWNDPKFGVAWPMEPAVISEKDANAPDFAPVHHLNS